MALELEHDEFTFQNFDNFAVREIGMKGLAGRTTGEHGPLIIFDETSPF